jgi:hypothetical protein
VPVMALRGVRKKQDCWKTPSFRVGAEEDRRRSTRDDVPDASWDDEEVRAWLEWWRPEGELWTLCSCIGLGPGLAKANEKRCWTAADMRAALQDYYQSPVQGAPPTSATATCASCPEPEPEPEPELAAQHRSDTHTSDQPVVFGGLPYECMVAVLDSGLTAVDLARLAIAAPALSRLLQDVATERLARHELRSKAPPRQAPPSLSIWHAAPTVAQRDFSGNELSSDHYYSSERVRLPMQILWELEGLASPLALLPCPGSALTSAEGGALVSRPVQVRNGGSDGATVVPVAGNPLSVGASAVCSRSVMRSGVHYAEFELVRMNEMDSGRGIRVGICRRNYLELEAGRGAVCRSPQGHSAQASADVRAVSREQPSATSGTDEYLRYLEWSRSQRAAASIFSTDHAWGFDARTGSLVHRGKRAWWRTKGVAPGVDIAR